MKKSFFVLLFVVAFFCAGNGATVYRTTPDRDFRAVDGAVASAHTGPGSNVIDLDAATPKHEFLGLGVSFAEASCHLLMKMPATERHAVLERVFGKSGIGLSIGRIHMGASDYSRQFYSYDDTPDDFTLEHFSIDHDRAEILPVIRETMAINSDIYLFSSQWSPPGWMKENSTLCGGPLKDGMLDAYTDYFVRFLSAYRDAGVHIHAFTLQNEPQTNQNFNSPTCIVPAEQEVAAIKMLVPKLRTAGIDAKAWLFDHNFNGTGRVERCLADVDLRTAIGGVAWHPYVGHPEMIAPLNARYPEIPMYMTEMGPHIDKTQRTIAWWGDLMARTFNAGCSAFCSWCLALDEDGQPNISLGFPCAGLIEIHSETCAVTPSSQFKAFRHVAPFVKRGARILDAKPSKARDSLSVVSFRNPDGSDVVFIAFDRSDQKFGRTQIQIRRHGQYLPVQVFANALTTVVFEKD